MCGKNGHGSLYFCHVLGSPPRVREKLCHICFFLGIVRITPACAGKTRYIQSSVWFGQDHPRVCGKNFKVDQTDHSVTGSPPRVREKQVDIVSCHFINGITPACAGKTYNLDSRDCYSRDHPRVCGKNTDESEPLETAMGSPPHVREKRAILFYLRTSFGITPACAGKTS